MKMLHSIMRSVAVPVFVAAMLPAAKIHAQSTKVEQPALSKSEINKLIKKVAASPDSLSYHQEYIKAAAKDPRDPAILDQYKKWEAKFPKNANVPFALGSALYHKEYPEAKPWLEKAVAINPKLAEAYFMLAIDAERWGKEDEGREFMGKAAEAEPTNPSYAFYYAMDFEHVDGGLWRKKLFELAERFPDHERGAQGLYWLATRTTDMNEKIEVYEKLRKLYPPEKFRWSSSGMQSLFDVYLQSDPAKARELAQSLRSENGWVGKDSIAMKVAEARKLMAEKSYVEPYRLLNSIKLPRYSQLIEYIALLKAEALDGAEGTQAAYDSLMVLHASKPSDALDAAVKKYGARLGKSDTEIRKELTHLREKASSPAPYFSLSQYTSDAKISLDDVKGKVVLLTFWFPGCGPCRGEFPHFEKVIQKFKGKDVVYLGINGVPEQDGYVIPFMNGTKYSFTPLKATSEWCEQTYKVRGFPSNFLIDQKGNVVFKGFMIHNEKEERMLELMINSLLPTT